MDKKKEEQQRREDQETQDKSTLKSDPGTTHTPDPQEHMEGPVSSLMQDLGEGFDDEKSAEKKEE